MMPAFWPWPKHIFPTLEAPALTYRALEARAILGPMSATSLGIERSKKEDSYMCVMSMVYDHYQPLFPQDRPSPWRNPAVEPTFPLQPVHHLTEEKARSLLEVIEAFNRAREAAKVVDELTGQKDCVDPKKQSLDRRVERLEKMLADFFAEVTAAREAKIKKAIEKSEKKLRKKTEKASRSL